MKGVGFIDDLNVNAKRKCINLFNDADCYSIITSISLHMLPPNKAIRKTLTKSYSLIIIYFIIIIYQYYHACVKKTYILN
jgi:hypothetical protein